MATYICDMCGDEPGLYMVGNQETGQQSSLGGACFGLVGLTTFLAGDAAFVDAVLLEKGYVPNAAEKRRRKEAEDANPDPNRTIATITEDQPRPPEDKPTEGEDDQPVSGLVDNDAGESVAGDPPGESAGGPPTSDGASLVGDDTAVDAPPY